MARFLVDKDTGEPVKEGDRVTSSRGQPGILEIARPDEGMNGKVYVRMDNERSARSFFPTVFGLEFVEART